MKGLRFKLDLVIVALVIAAFVAVAAERLGTVPVPEGDEAFTLQVPYEMLNHGKLALPMLRYLGGNIENTWHSFIPVYFVILSGFHELFGFGLEQGRAFNLMTAALTLLMIYLIGRRLFDWRAGLIAVVLLIGDQTFFERSRLLRDDYAAAAFALLAFYLYEMAEERKKAALYVAAGLAAGAGVMSHTNMLYMIGAVGLLILMRDGWRAFASRKLYLFGLSALAVMAYEIVYDLIDYKNFLLQNRGDDVHFRVLDGGGLWQNLLEERLRYLKWYTGGLMFPGLPQTTLRIFQLLTIAAIIYLLVVFARAIRRRNLLGDPRARLLVVTVVTVMFHALIVSHKRMFYLAHIVPWFALAVGVMLRDGMDRISALRASQWPRARLAHRAAVIVCAVLAIGFLSLLVAQGRRYLAEVRNPNLASFAEFTAAIRDIVPEGLCPVAIKNPSVWLAFPEKDRCFATIENRFKEEAYADIDGKEYALVTRPNALPERVDNAAGGYHLLGEMWNTPYGNLLIYYTGADPSYLAIKTEALRVLRRDGRLHHSRVRGKQLCLRSQAEPMSDLLQATNVDRKMTDKTSLTVWLERARATDSRKLALLAFLLGAAITMMYRPFSQLEVGDAAIYDYIAQSILRGQVPYRDVVDIKGPLAPQLSALAMVAGKAAGLRDIIAVRLFHVLLVGLLSAVSFLVAEAYFRSRLAGLIAFLIPLMFPSYVEMMVAGTQPKLLMMVFGMLSLLLIAKDRPFWAGFCSMLSCLCWQPGLMFTGVAVLMFSRYLTSWRDLRALKAVAGALTPLIVTLVCFYLLGALGDMWAWTITYNYSVFGPAAKRSLAEAGDHLWKIMHRVFQPDIFLLCGSGLGLMVFLAGRARAKMKEQGALRAPDLFIDAIAIPPLIYLGFCFINIQGGPDLIPLVPFVGIFGAWLFAQAGRVAAQSGFGKHRASRPVLEVIVPGAAMVVILVLGLHRSAAYKVEGWTLKDQDKALEAVSLLLTPEDKIYVHGTVEILTLLGKPNLNPYVFLDWGADDFVVGRRNTTFSSLIEEMDAQAPKLVSLSRLRKVNHRAELEKWVDDHYDKLESFTYESLYVRKQ